MKKSKIITLVTLLAFFLALIFVYAALLDYNEKKAAEELDNNSSDDQIAVVGYSANDITGIEYSADEVKVSLVLDGGAWRISDDAEFPVDQDMVSKMTSGIVSITASRTITEGELADYGFDTPVLSIEITCTDGTKNTYSLGSTNSYNDETYLLANDTVYMFSDTLSSLFDYSKDELVKISDSLPGEIDEESVNRISIDNGNGDTNTITDTDGISEMATEMIKYINFKNVAGYGLDAEELTSYGISSDSPIIEIEYSVATAESGTTVAKADFKVVFGMYGEDQYCYTTPDSDMTYTISKTNYEALMNFIYHTADTADETAE